MKNSIFCEVNKKGFKSMHLNFMKILLSTIVNKFITQKFVKYQKLILPYFSNVTEKWQSKSKVTVPSFVVLQL